MSHIDPDTLALLAMSELQPTPAERRHLAVCDECAAELASLSRTASVGRASGGVASVAPSPELWERIRAELGLGAGGGSGDSSAVVPPLTPVEPRGLRGPVEPRGAAEGREPAEPRDTAAEPRDAAALREPFELREPAGLVEPVELRGPVEVRGPAELREPVELDGRRGRRGARRWLPVVAAAAIVGLVGGLGIGAWVGVTSTPTGAVVARAALDPFPDWPDARGSAVVQQLPDGSREVVVDVDDAVTAVPAASDADPLREVWLIAGDSSGLVSIGFLDGTSGRFAVPAGLDLSVYSLVDISAEPDNGDPTHSGDSIVRGPLRAG
ncbi:anti-sigma factor [Herbiconiux sp. CPCC 205716]|uniref:Anti-sigma factor n=1 Tax=Herbiconiux gentiana TaxID=2970912 RepID=A0ABT2GJC4_9MICO|nr:anti-sigma factor [Herbiconiux gentiana]MCS5716321.1 anti-sigma factor [Herbiconiux gentiana]